MNDKFHRQDAGSIYVPPGGPPPVSPPSPEIYGLMGEANIFRMTLDFYKELESSSIAGMFPEDMAAASEKLGAYLVSRLGGPPIYQERHGDPRLRMRHIPFIINESSRQIWLACFKKVLDQAETKYQFPAQHKPSFWNFIEGFSGWMVNSSP